MSYPELHLESLPNYPSLFVGIASARQHGQPLSGNSALILGVVLAFFIVAGLVVLVLLLRRFRRHDATKRRHSNHDAAYIIQVEGQGQKEQDGGLEDETSHLRKQSDDENDDDSEDIHIENPNFKERLKRRPRSQTSKNPNRKSKEEICLEVKTFMFDENKPPGQS